jgi:hypothetical protein
MVRLSMQVHRKIAGTTCNVSSFQTAATIPCGRIPPVQKEAVLIRATKRFFVMSIKTVDLEMLAKMTGNVYESVAILSKRARQLSTNTKNELDEKLAYFEGFEQELEDPRFQEEQARVSLEYERQSEPTENSIKEMLNNEIYFRKAIDETDPYAL